MGKIELTEEILQKWIEDHVVKNRYVVFFDRTGLEAVFWVLPATKTWHFATVTLANNTSRENLEKILKEKEIKFFDADVDWKFGKVKFWNWTPFAMFCMYYLQKSENEKFKKRDYEAYCTNGGEIIILPKVSSNNLINFCIKLTNANKPNEDPKSFLSKKELEIPIYPVVRFDWPTDTAQAAPIN